MTDSDATSELGHLRLLAQVSDVITTTDDTAAALRDLAHLFLPALADWAVVDVVTDDNRAERVAVIHSDPTRVPPGLERELPPLPDESASPLVRALRDGEVIAVHRFEPIEEADCAVHREQLELFAQLGAAHALVVPLMSRGIAVGAFTLVRSAPSTQFTATEIRLVEGIARRTALAVDNARLYAQQLDAAVAFQRSLLPSLPQPDHLRLTARYVPAREGSEIGGDWYDAFVARDGVPTVVVGDVVGHDVHASARMAELRNLLRGCSWNADPSPAAVLSLLDDAVRGLELPAIASVVCGRIDHRADGYLFRWASAGHLPPLLVGTHGSVEFIRGDSGVLIGVSGAHGYRDNVTPIAEGSRLVLFTDGLIEHRGDLAEGLAQLARTATDLADLPLDDLCDGLISELAEPCDDDIALLAVEFGAVGGGMGD